MHYDITAKALLELDAKAILRHIVGLDVADARVIEVKQELLSVKIADAPFLIEIRRPRKPGKSILLLEWQSRWVKEKPLSLIAYRTALRIKFGLPVQTVMILLTPSKRASARYADSEIDFSFHLVKLWELRASDWIHSAPALLPFVPLMHGGMDALDEIEKAIYDCGEKREIQATLITAAFIFIGLRDKAASKKILKRWRGIMLESPAYEMIKAEGRKEGRLEGRTEGSYSSKIEIARQMLKEGLARELIARVTGLAQDEVERLEQARAGG